VLTAFDKLDLPQRRAPHLASLLSVRLSCAGPRGNTGASGARALCAESVLDLRHIWCGSRYLPICR